MMREGHQARELAWSSCFLILETAHILKEEYGIEMEEVKPE